MARIIHNLKLLGIALVVSICCAYIIKHPDIFVSSILNLQEIQEIEEKHWDIAYKTDNQLLDVFLPMTWEQQWSLNVVIAYGPDIKVHVDQLTWQLLYSDIKEESGYISLEFNTIDAITPEESLFYIPFSGDSNHVLIEKADMTYKNETRLLAIGKLSVTSVHGQ